jgi:undecaprenyl-diphosphatase
MTPSGALGQRPVVLVGLVSVVLVIAAVASYGGGSLLETWDEPIQRWVQDQRSGSSEGFFRVISRLGSNIVVFPLGAVVAFLAWRRCPPLAVAVIGAVALRPVFEFVMKETVARPRPDIDRLVDGVGFSHPSGHVLATVTLYSLIPAVLALYVGRGTIWKLAWVFPIFLVPAMAMTRVFLGVHWATDVAAAMLWGGLYLVMVERIFAWLHIEPFDHGALPPVPEEKVLQSATTSQLS